MSGKILQAMKYIMCAFWYVLCCIDGNVYESSLRKYISCHGICCSLLLCLYPLVCSTLGKYLSVSYVAYVASLLL